MFPIALTRKMVAYKVSFTAFMYTLVLLSLDSCVELLLVHEGAEVAAVVPERFESTSSKEEFIFCLLCLSNRFQLNEALGCVLIDSQSLKAHLEWQ